MKRQILFRAQCKNSKRWATGFYVEQHLGSRMTPMIYNDEVRGTDDWTEINADTLGQFTGFCDKNGRQVFEGDIVRSDQYPFSASDAKDNYYGEICWDEPSSQFFIWLFKNPKSKVAGIAEGNTDEITAASVAQYEVIGNVHMKKWAFVEAEETK